MKTSQRHIITLQKTAVVFAAVLATSAILPLAARADGDSDREQIAEFYANLDRQPTTASLEPSAVGSGTRLNYIKAVRPAHSKKMGRQPKTTVDDTVDQGRARGSTMTAWFNSNRPGYVRVNQS